MTNPLLAESRGTQNTTTGKMSLRLVNKSGVNIAQVTTVQIIITCLIRYKISLKKVKTVNYIGIKEGKYCLSLLVTKSTYCMWDK